MTNLLVLQVKLQTTIMKHRAKVEQCLFLASLRKLGGLSPTAGSWKWIYDLSNQLGYRDLFHIRCSGAMLELVHRHLRDLNLLGDG